MHLYTVGRVLKAYARASLYCWKSIEKLTGVHRYTVLSVLRAGMRALLYC